MSIRSREIKLTAPVGFRLPPLSDAGGGVFEGPAETVELDATYYDTSDLRLTRAGALLRFRSDDGWEVNLPRPANGESGPADLREYSFLGERDQQPPDPALDLVRALIRRESVAPVARLRTIRRQLPINSRDGVRVAEIRDEQVEVVEGSALEQHFREIAIGLTDDATDAHCSALLTRLRLTSAASADPVPTIVRVLGPLATAPPDVQAPTIDNESSVEEVVRAAIAACVAKLVAHDPGVRLGTDDEDVHQARVATRRLRSHLQAFGPLLDEEWATELRDELRWVGEVLGAVRDADVLQSRLDREISRLPVVDRDPARSLLARLDGDLERRRIQLLEAFRGDRYLSLLDRLVLAARRPRLMVGIEHEPDAQVLRELVRRPWRKLADSVAELGDDPPDNDLHAVRIRSKRVRYATEAVQPAFGKPARAFARALTDLQDVLGEHQDAVFAAEWLRAAAARTDDEAVGFAAGQLATLEHLDALAAREAWPAVWKQASRRRLRNWLYEQPWR